MNFALFSVLAVASAQFTGCLNYSASLGGIMAYCTAQNNCTAFNFCSRLGNATPSTCPTTSQTCTGTACAPGQYVSDPKTCSKCQDQCSQQTTASVCNGMTSCQWNSYCFDVGTVTNYPCSGATEATCTSDPSGCFWYDLSETICGASYLSGGACTQCNSSVSSLIGPLSRMVGQTCTYTADSANGYTMGASLSINAFGIGTAGTGSCVAIPAGSGASADQAAITTYFASSGAIGSGSTGTCVATTPAPSSAPTTGKPAAGTNGNGSSMCYPCLALVGMLLSFLAY